MCGVSLFSDGEILLPTSPRSLAQRLCSRRAPDIKRTSTKLTCTVIFISVAVDECKRPNRAADFTAILAASHRAMAHASKRSAFMCTTNTPESGERSPECNLNDHLDDLARNLPRPGPEVQQMMDPEAVSQLLATGCCRNHCLAQFTDPAQVLCLRQPLFSMSRSERRIYHANNPSVRAHALERNPHPKLFLLTDSELRNICIKAYRGLMCIPKNETWTKILEDARSTDAAAHEVRTRTCCAALMLR
jgi:hypothetical protein